ncbi:MAG: nucleotide exchange factor GrpE [Spiroplasma sp.]|nr:nucleotide exchange factor GrpE [Spiroplasma sp.]
MSEKKDKKFKANSFDDQVDLAANQETLKEEQEIKPEKIKSVSQLTEENQDLLKQVADLQKTLTKLKDEQKKLILATKVNTLKEQEVRNEDFKKYANQKIIKETILPLLLEFERALKFKTDNKDVQNFLIGFKYIFDNFKNNLKQEGLTAITERIGNQFDSSKANAIEQIEITTETNDQKDNTIAEVLLTGYQLHDWVISPVQVKIYKLKNEKKEINEENK